MHAIRDFRNLPDAKAKHLAADGYIAQAIVAIAMGDPYSDSKSARPEEVASRGVAKLLGKSRGSAWDREFGKVYQDVVAAVEKERPKTADDIVGMLEDQQGQDAEKALVKKVLAGLKQKKP